MEDQVLAALRRVSGVTSAYVVGAGGVEGSSADGALAETQGALLAALAGAVRQATDDLDLGELGEFLVEAGSGAIMAGALPNGKAAVVVTGAGTNLGLVRVELRRLRRSAAQP
jgi:predicted regulator of Ras-like GTPase activity (Roadblock/LC7/MglB family)